MLWEGVGAHKINGMRKLCEYYVKMQHLTTLTRKLKAGLRWLFQNGQRLSVQQERQ